jgi:DNA (cytosine-5)-methyltransferase 1
MTIRFLSLFSGIEAASIAFRPLGWECVGFSEIEPFPCAVLTHYYKSVPNLGDITKITEGQIAALGRVDLVIFGSPCTDFSIAGKRAGLKDEKGNITRSGLFYAAMDIVRFARKHCGLRWAILENVPGIYSSNEGRDFSTVIGEMVGCGFDVPADGWSNSGIALGPDGLCEWACLDAQYFGVAQRRRRLFAVADYAIFDSGNWACRSSVLLERESMRWDTSPERGKRKADTQDVGHGTETSDKSRPIAFKPGQSADARTMGAQEDVACTLESGGGGNNKQAVAYGVGGKDIGFALRASASHSGDKGDGGINTTMVACYENCVDREVSPTLTSKMQGSSGWAPHNETEHLVACYENHAQDSRVKDCGDLAPQLNAKAGTGGNNLPIVTTARQTAIGEYADDNTASTVKARDYKDATDLVCYRTNAAGQIMDQGEKSAALNTFTDPSAQILLAPSVTASNNPSRSPQSSEITQQVAAVHAATMAVRRLTPTECARLQGFPDQYLDNIPIKPVPASGQAKARKRMDDGDPMFIEIDGVIWKVSNADAPKYKALGNSFAVPVVAYIGRRIQKIMDSGESL